MIAKDKGYDSLLESLRKEGFSARRFVTIADIPALARSVPAPSAGTEAERLARVVRDLRARGDHAPRRLRKLSNTINALFAKSLPSATVDELILALQREGYVTLDGAKVTYDLPPP